MTYTATSSPGGLGRRALYTALHLSVMLQHTINITYFLGTEKSAAKNAKRKSERQKCQTIKST